MRVTAHSHSGLRCRPPASSRCMGTGETGSIESRQSLGPAWALVSRRFLDVVLPFRCLSFCLLQQPLLLSLKVRDFLGPMRPLPACLLAFLSHVGLCQRKTTEHLKCYFTIYVHSREPIKGKQNESCVIKEEKPQEAPSPESAKKTEDDARGAKTYSERASSRVYWTETLEGERNKFNEERRGRHGRERTTFLKNLTTQRPAGLTM